MKDKVAVIITSIHKPSEALQCVAEGCKREGYQFIVIGDEASPADFSLEGCRFYSLQEQLKLGLRFSEICPTGHYARKNIGYLLAIRAGADMIIDLDDDCIPYQRFWSPRHRYQKAHTNSGGGWVNIYRYFSEVQIWPRGFPLDRVNDVVDDFDALPVEELDCPIQQGLTDGDPDVDAIYRLILPSPQAFRADRRVTLKNCSWSPFNSQNTTWWSVAFPLLYLPAYCRFRLTDIWRSFVAQRIAWANDWGVLFHESTSRQERNPHNLMRDFEDELPGYLSNRAICEILSKLQLKTGVEYLTDNLLKCYQELVNAGVFDQRELNLLESWISDLLKQKSYVAHEELG